MRKVCFTIIILLFANCIYAQDYKHSIGIVAGSLNGLSYKQMVNENLVFQADLGLGLLSTRGQAYLIYNDSYFDDLVLDSKISKVKWIQNEINLWSFQFQPSLYSQKNIVNLTWGNIAGFIGGGITLGYSTELIPELSNSFYIYDYGKVGANIITGIELIFKKVPITLGVDFRPGFGMLVTRDVVLIQKEPGDPVVEVYNTIIYPMFDWGLAMSLRYAF